MLRASWAIAGPWSRTVVVTPERAIRGEAGADVEVAVACGVDTPPVGERAVALHRAGKVSEWLLVPEWEVARHDWLPPRAHEAAR
jgi:hypothetical protein